MRFAWRKRFLAVVAAIYVPNPGDCADAVEVIDEPLTVWAIVGNHTRERCNFIVTDPKTRKIYLAGKLPPGRLDLRARRYATKFFLSHYFEVGYWLHYQKPPPAPFVIARMGHVHYVEPPHAQEIGVPPFWNQLRTSVDNRP